MYNKNIYIYIYINYHGINNLTFRLLLLRLQFESYLTHYFLKSYFYNIADRDIQCIYKNKYVYLSIDRN